MVDIVPDTFEPLLPKKPVAHYDKEAAGGTSWLHAVTLGYTWLYLVTLGYTWLHSAKIKLYKLVTGYKFIYAFLISN